MSVTAVFVNIKFSKDKIFMPLPKNPRRRHYVFECLIWLLPTSINVYSAWCNIYSFSEGVWMKLATYIQHVSGHRWERFQGQKSNVKVMTSLYAIMVQTCILMVASACVEGAPCGAGAPLFPPVHLLPHLFPLFAFLFHWLYLFSSFVHPFPFYQNSPTPFPGQRSQKATEPGFSLCFVVCNLCYLYSLVKMDCGVLFYLV